MGNLIREGGVPGTGSSGGWMLPDTCIGAGFVWLCVELLVMEEAQKVFYSMPLRDLMFWNFW
jgi:hypothetical protein